MTSDTALISIIMPVKSYDASFLDDAIGSLSKQTSPRWRLLVVDDGADGLDRVLARHVDPRITLLSNDSSGFAAAINTGIWSAATDFVALLFADDMWAPDAVEMLVSHMANHPDIDFFHSSRRFVDADGNALSAVYEARETFDLDDFPSGSPVKHLLCFRRERALALGGIDETLPPMGPDDWDFVWCMAETGARFMAVKQCLYIYRDHRDHYRLTTHLPRTVHLRGIRKMLRKHGVGRRRIRSEIRDAKRTYLRQCLYRSRFDRWVKQRFGHDPQHGWYFTYRPVDQS